MQIDVVASVGEARSDEFIHKTVVVIDVLRATSTMIAALANGCIAVVPVETVLQAKELQGQGDLLGGERFCKKIPGFDFGNSPGEYTPSAVGGKKVILTTTNGTRGIQKAMKADHVLAGALINGRACAAAAAEFKRDVVLVCAGTQDVFALEDGLCAGQLVTELIGLIGDKHTQINDFGLAMMNCYLHLQSNITETLLKTSNGKRLCKLGFRDDIAFCGESNTFATVPVLQNDRMVPHSPIVF